MYLRQGTYLQGGKYQIVSVLGQGGFGITYLAEQVLVKRKVCIKEFFPKEYYKRDDDSSAATLVSDGFAESMNRFKAKFIKEAQTIAALDHPNIIHIFEIFEENGTAYYVMEYVEGESLSDKVKRSGAMDEAEAIGYIHQIAEALGYIHSEQIMHLDVKPANVMVRSRDNRAILIDFGLAKHYDTASGEATSTTPVGVSHGFAPMEQYKEGGVSTFSPETDIYSLGATLYYLVTGTIPPQASDISEDGLPTLPSHLSVGVRRAITTAMQSRRKDRPHSIAEFILSINGDGWGTNSSMNDDTTIVPQTNIATNTNKTICKSKSKKSKTNAKPNGCSIFLYSLIVITLISLAIHFLVLPIVHDIWWPKLHYTTIHDGVLYPDDLGEEWYEKNVISNTYENGKGTMILRFGITEFDMESSARYAPLETISFPDCITNVNLGPWVTNLERITFPESIRNISAIPYGDDAHYWPVSLKEFKGKYAKDGGRILVKEGELILFAGSGLTEYTIPKYVSSIGESAFLSTQIKSITIPNSVISIGKGAFFAASLTSVTIPDSVTSIGKGTFRDCENLTSVTIPDSVTSIGDDAFYGCSSLTSVTIPDSVTSIGKGTFRGCENLTSVTIPNSVTSIGDAAFYACTSLTSVTIGNGVTTIGKWAFNDCSSLTSVTIPNSVTTIGKGAFYDCTSLTSVYCKATTPPTGDLYMFDDNVSGRKIYVPRQYVEAYKKAEGWSKYADQIVGSDFKMRIFPRIR